MCIRDSNMTDVIDIPTINRTQELPLIKRGGERISRIGRIVKDPTDDIEQWVTFKPNDKVISGNDPEMKYRRKYGQGKKGIHWGQRKLAMSIIQFLTEFWNPTEVPQPILVYI